MELYKVKIPAGLHTTHPWYPFFFFTTAEKAKNYVKKSGGEYIGKVDLKMHHTAMMKGYVRLDGGCYETYAGRYGYGVRQHHPNKESKLKCNQYHLVTYYIEQ